MNLKKQIILVFILSLFFLFSYFFLFSKFIIYPTVIPMTSGGNTYLFADWTAVLGANLCKELGYDVYLKNPCDPWGRTHVYGEILLHIPFVEKFKKFYFFILPAIINYIFVVVVLASLSFKSFKSYINYFTALAILFSFPVILAIERGQFDILMFILMVILAHNKNKIINLFILVFTTISKFYPIALTIIFFFEKNLKKIFINFLIFLIIILSIFFIQSEEMLKVFANKGQGAAFGIYDFSLIGTFNFFKNSNILISNTNYSFFIFLLLSIPAVIFFIKIIKYFSKEIIINKLDYNFFEDKLYIFASAIILFCYFFSSNFVYREIFIIGLIPWIIKIYISNKDLSFFSFYYYFLMFKFLISTPITYIYMNKIIQNINPILLIIKYTMDLYIVSFIAGIFLVFLIKSLNIQKIK
tara:strand:+ start:56 stop:1294 length:1239 start_codon:yes stop_codon:yes gene_type:complete